MIARRGAPLAATRVMPGVAEVVEAEADEAGASSAGSQVRWRKLWRSSSGRCSGGAPHQRLLLPDLRLNAADLVLAVLPQEPGVVKGPNCPGRPRC